MDQGELPAELAREIRAVPRELGIAHDAAALRHAANEPLHGERRADDAAVGTLGNRLGNHHAGRVGRPDAGQLTVPVEAHRQARDGIGAQDQRMRAGPRPAVDHHVDAPVLLHGAARKEFRARDIEAARGDGLGKPARQRIEIAGVERSGTSCGHRHSVGRRWPPSTVSTLPVMNEPASDASSSSGPSSSAGEPSRCIGTCAIMRLPPSVSQYGALSSVEM